MSTYANTLPPANMSDTEISGEVARVRSCGENDDGSHFVAGALASGEQFCGVIDNIIDLREGSRYRLLGAWPMEEGKYGWQFRFQLVVPEIPTTAGGAAWYLAKHANGIGPATAEKLVARYGPADVVRIVIDEPQRLADDGIMQIALAREASDSLRVICDPSLRDAMIALHDMLRGTGIYGRAIKQALRLWKSHAPERIRARPFTMMLNGLAGCGFLKCDLIYLKLGHSPSRMLRQALAAWHAITRASAENGDTWLSLEASMKAVTERIAGTTPRPRRALALLCRAGHATTRIDAKGRVWVANRANAASERTVARRLLELLDGAPQWPEVGHADRTIPVGVGVAD